MEMRSELKDDFFIRYLFKDSYKHNCVLEDFPYHVEELISLGILDPKLKKLNDKGNWEEVKLPEGTSIFTRLTLSREQVSELLPLLEAFVNDGKLPTR